MIDLNGKRVMVYPGPTDFRYGINGLSLLVGQREEGVVYALCGKSGKSLKFLEFEKDAVWLTQVKIARGRLPFSKAGAGAEASATMMTVIRTALRNGLIPERYLAWLFENSRKLPTERLMPWSDDVPDSCRALAK